MSRLAGRTRRGASRRNAGVGFRDRCRRRGLQPTGSRPLATAPPNRISERSTSSTRVATTAVASSRQSLCHRSFRAIAVLRAAQAARRL